jgi:hypothetical protein
VEIGSFAAKHRVRLDVHAQVEIALFPAAAAGGAARRNAAAISVPVAG